MPLAHPSVHAAFCASAERHAERPFLECLPETARAYGIEPRAYSYAEVQREVERLRSAYAAAGFGHGHRAGLALENRPGFVLHWFALNALGVSVVPVSADWRASELEYLCAHSEICLAIAPRSRGRELAQAARAAGRPLVVSAPDLNELEAAPFAPPAANRAPDQRTECALLYTSGTTGRPKGCILPNEYFLTAGEWYATAGGLCEVHTGVERMLTPLPMSHMNAMACSTMVMMLTGGCLIALDRFHPRSWWQSVRASRATIMHYLGVMPALLLAQPASDRDREHEVRFGFGAGVNPRHHATFEARFGFPLLEAWAMTETGCAAVIIANREPRLIGTSCFGRAEPWLDYRVVADDGCDVPVDTPGELLVRRAGLEPRFGFFAGYLKDPTATEEAWKGGYFHTGDVVRVDSGGHFHFVDRRKNVIRRSGENIAAVEVEGVLMQLPTVQAVGVTAVPDALRGEEVMACVVAQAPVEVQTRRALAEEIVRFCLARLAYFKAPGYVTFCDELPRTPTEKIQRARLKELASSALESGRCIDTRSLKRRQDAATA